MSWSPKEAGRQTLDPTNRNRIGHSPAGKAAHQAEAAHKSPPCDDHAEQKRCAVIVSEHGAIVHRMSQKSPPERAIALDYVMRV